MTRDGHPADDWYVRDLELRDATGNYWHPRTHAYDIEGAVKRFDEAASLCTREAYRVRVELTSDLEFSPADLWSPSLVALPERGASTALHAARKRDGIQVQLKEVLGAGTALRDLGYAHPGPMLHVSITPRELSHGRVRLLHATDGRGRDLMEMPEPVISGTDGQDYFGLRNLAGAKRLRVTFVVRKSYWPGLLAQPFQGQ